MSYQNLKSVHVKGFKSIKDQNIEIQAMNVLIGQNGAGKSNFINLFKFIRNIIQGHLKITSQKIGSDVLLFYGSAETEKITISLDFNPNYYEVNLIPARGKDTLIIESELAGYKGSSSYHDPYWKAVATAEEESQLSLKAKNNKVAEYVYDVLKNWRVYHFHDTSESADLKKLNSTSDYRILFEDASNIAPFLYVMKNNAKDHYDRIVKTIQLVIPFFKDFVLEPSPTNAEKIRIEWQDIYSEKIFTAHELSDGSIRFICMATLLLQKNLPKVILLDEPELGLHPTAITILAGLLKKASKRSQVIVSTQSVNLVNEFEADDIIVVEKNDSESVFKRLDTKNLEYWLNDYSLGDLWDKNIIGGKP